MARASRDFLCAMEIYTNQMWMATFGVIADRALLLYQAKIILFEQADQLTELHRLR